MKKTNRYRGTFICLVAVLSLWSTAEAQQAARILEETGVKGGLVVHLGCGDGRLTAALRANDSYLVHGLDKNPENIEQARVHIESLALYGKVSVEHWRGERLPYTDNLVNLIVARKPVGVPIDELMRVLAPNGVVYINTGKTWKKKVKPWPAEIDEWTHFLHSASNNAVAQDSIVGPPHHLQWQGKPKFARAHEQIATLSASVTAGGRMFYIIDEAQQADIRFPSRWFLVARDAFNGVVLWKRPIPSWANQFRRFRSGPADLPFRLVAGRDRLYVTLGIDAPVSALEPATGETLYVYQGTENTRQIARVGGTLIMLVDTGPQNTAQVDSEIRRGLKPAPGVRRIIAAGASGDSILWSKTIESFVHPSLAAQKDRLFYQTTDTVFCLDMADGDGLWRSPIERMQLKGHEVGWESPTLIVQGKIVYSADFKQMVALSVDDGKQLWSAQAWPGYNSPPDIFVIDDMVWTKDKNVTRNGFNKLTGELKKQIPSVKGYMHHRCYRNKATERFIILGNQGVQFLDVESGEIWQNYWIRGTCQYGIMPANGLLYVTPDSCACNLTAKLNGFYALAAGRKSAPEDREDVRFEKGPAYGRIAASDHAQSDDWPTYRHDAARSSISEAKVDPALDPLWQVDLGGRLSSVVAAGGRVFVAAVDAHTVFALGADDGSRLRSYTVGGRVDSPPTVYKGMVLFGSADGWLYALRARDGKLAWRFRTAPEDRRTFVNGQLESVWPVHGSVLVKGGVLIVTAGRSSYLDGGIVLYRLEPETGSQISSAVVYSPDPEERKQPADAGKEIRGLLSDVLLVEGDDVYMRHVKLDFETGAETGTGVHLFTPLGFLDDTWWHRGYWVINDEFLSHWSAWWRVGNQVPSGRILSYNESSVFGYGRDQYVGGNTGQWRGGEKYQLFAFDRNSDARKPRQTARQPAKGKRGRKTPATEPLDYRWTTRGPLFVTAMVVAGKTMFIAGPPAVVRTEAVKGEQALALENPQEIVDAWAGRKGALLWAVSAEDGARLAEYHLDALPVFDGMVATNGRIYLPMKNGRLLCLANK